MEEDTAIREKRRRDAMRAGVVAALPKSRRLRSSIYLLPNMITATSFFCGFLSIKLTFDGALQGGSAVALDRFVLAAYALLIAAVADALDGSVARLTRTQSNFGVQFDSLSDLVSFGVAPALLAYHFALKDLGRLGFGIAFLYAVCGALRLARFNVMSNAGKASGNFTGIPIPMAAAPVAVYVLAYQDLAGWLSAADMAEWRRQIAAFLTAPEINAWFLFGITFLLAFGMISSIEYMSHKKLRLPRKHPFRVFAAVLAAMVLLFSIEFTLTLTVLLIAYCLHGPVLWLFSRSRRHEIPEEEIFDAGEEDEFSDEEGTENT